jgi:hypothetical protein
MGSSLEEYPGLVAEDVFGDGDDTWFCEGGGFENFMGNVAIRSKDDKSELKKCRSATVRSSWTEILYILVKHRYTTQRTTGPLF